METFQELAPIQVLGWGSVYAQSISLEANHKVMEWFRWTFVFVT